jgi:hypothetical protein
LEAEYLLAEEQTLRPLSHRELEFETLNQALESISVADLPPSLGMELLWPHRRLINFCVEGYHLPDVDAPAPDIAPEGIEIRTPPWESIDAALDLLAK